MAGRGRGNGSLNRRRDNQRANVGIGGRQAEVLFKHFSTYRFYANNFLADPLWKASRMGQQFAYQLLQNAKLGCSWTAKSTSRSFKCQIQHAACL